MGKLPFYKNLKEARIQKKLTQNQVAELIQIKQSNLSKYENGTLEPNMEQLSKLALLYNVKTDWLLGIDNKEKGE